MAPGTMRLLAHALSIFSSTWALPTNQIPLHPAEPPKQQSLPEITKHRPLHGRFLHVTDFHPDRFYQVYTSTAAGSACHRGQGPAGIYGAETSECDSPIALVNKTFTWIEEHLKDEVDFVVWTGDSARHDNDDHIPRDAEQVTSLNEFMVHKMSEVFGKDEPDEENPNNDFVIPIVPNLGNNDVLPHNIMTAGPNKWTRTYANVWKQFIPEVQKHSFEQGGWFSVEVIPNRLAVFSLNTLYFFTSNAAVDGCATKSEPGYRQMEWLRIQLQFLRERGMKALLIGHVPPARTDAKTQWDETCWQKYALWLERYRDVVIAGLWGHMNYDHFFLQDFEDIGKNTKNGRMRALEEEEEDNDDVRAELSSNYFVDLREQWARLPKPPRSLHWTADEKETAMDELMRSSDEERPAWGSEELISTTTKKNKRRKSGRSKKDKQREKQKKFMKEVGGEWAERFAVSFSSASVVPNLLPVVRVFEYNISGLEDTAAIPASSEMLLESSKADGDWTGDDEAWQGDAIESENDEPDDLSTTKRKKSKSKKKRKHKFPLPSPPSSTAPPGPAYSPQSLSLLGYTQYLANLTHINNDFTSSKWKSGKHKGKKPHDKDHTPRPKKFAFEKHYDTRNDSVYHLEDLTVRSMLDLARRIGEFDADAVDETGEEVGEERSPELAEENDSEYRGVEAEEKKKKKKKGKKHKGKHGKGGKHGKHSARNEPWYTFIRRAFVETLAPEEIEDEFGW